MALIKEFAQQGNWLFRWRSYLPLAMPPLVLFAVWEASTSNTAFGSEVWQGVCLGVSSVGLALRCLTVGYVPVGTSGRGTQQPGARCLNTTGPYSVVRHPLYVGNYLIGLGVSLIAPPWWLPAIYTLTFWLYYERIMFSEEQFLRTRFGSEFERWASQTPAFVPNPSRWRASALPWSLRNALRREYTGMLVVVVAHSGVEMARRWFSDQQPWLSPLWIALLIVGVSAYCVLRTLKKKTPLLDVAGR